MARTSLDLASRKVHHNHVVRKSYAVVYALRRRWNGVLSRNE